MNRRRFLVSAGVTVGAAGLLGRPANAARAFAATETYFVNGVAVRRYRPSLQADHECTAGLTGRRPAVVMVHGGAHAGWVWERHATYLAGHGWDCHVLDWYHHGRSARLPQETFVARSITDVRTEIGHVVGGLPRNTRYVLMGHSMGALAVLYSAQWLDPDALVLVTPVVPTEVGAEPIPIPIDPTQPFAVPPFEVAKGMFYSTMSDAEARPYYERLQPESPRAVWEATRWTVSVDLAAITMPAMTVAAEADALTPPAAVRQLADRLRCRHVEWPAIGHGDVLLKEQGWRAVAQDIERWMHSAARPAA